MARNYQTRHTLIERALDHSENAAWEEFIAFYKHLVLSILEQYRVSPNDIADLTQVIMIKVSAKLNTYDPSKGKFRTWLGTLTRNEIIMYYRHQQSKKAQVNANNNSEEILASLSTHSNHDQIVEREWQNHIAKIAWDNIQRDFSANALTSFDLYVKGLDNESIALQTSLSTRSVIIFRSRIKKALRDEADRLKRDMDH